MTALEKYRAFPGRYMEQAFNQRRFDVLDKLFVAGVLGRVKHNTIPFLAAFADWHGTVDDIMVDGD